MNLKDRDAMAHEKYAVPMASQDAAVKHEPHPQPKIDFPASVTPKPKIGDMNADVIIMMDTADEAEAAAAVLTPGIHHQEWKKYDHNFEKFKSRLTDKSPARFAGCLGSYQKVTIGGVSVLVYKTELHMHEDDKSLPLKDALAQLIVDVKPLVFLTTGTSGGVSKLQRLGDVVMATSARFYTKLEFIALNGKTFDSAFHIPFKYIPVAEKIMNEFSKHITTAERPDCCVVSPHMHPIDIMPATHNMPVLTTDYFEFGTTKNDLGRVGCCVEMDDAVLGMVCSEMKNPPHWASIRNISDPVINGNLEDHEQNACAEYFYKNFGYWTSINSALASWAVAAALVSA